MHLHALGSLTPGTLTLRIEAKTRDGCGVSDAC